MPRNVVFVLYTGIQALDLVGPHEVFVGANRVLDLKNSREPRYDLMLASVDGATVGSESGLGLAAHGGLPNPSGPFDTIVVPGGEGSRNVSEERADLISWLAASAPNARRVATVCTGAFLAAAAGLCSNRRVTTHWAFAGALASDYPDIDVQPDSIYVTDGSLWSSAGVTAGIDLALALVQQDLGMETAQTIARHLVVYLRRPGGQSQFGAPVWISGPTTEPIERARNLIHDDPAADHSVARLAERVGLSERHFARRFRNEVGEPPARYVERIRVQVARNLLDSADPGLDAVALECGFGSTETMRRAFHRRLETSPDAYRRQFRS